MRRCCETTSCCQACWSPAMQWRTNLPRASCSAACSGVRCKVTSCRDRAGFSGVLCAAIPGEGRGASRRVSSLRFCNAVPDPRVARPTSPVPGIAMCSTLMHLYTHASRIRFPFPDRRANCPSASSPRGSPLPAARGPCAVPASVPSSALSCRYRPARCHQDPMLSERSVPPPGPPPPAEVELLRELD